MTKVQKYIENVIGIKDFNVLYQCDKYSLVVKKETNTIYGYKKGYRVEFTEWLSDSIGRIYKIDGLTSAQCLEALENITKIIK